jgi:hypothetical protein
MKIRKINESKEDFLYIRGIYREFQKDIKEHFDLVFVELMDKYYKSETSGDVSHTTYTIIKKLVSNKGFDGLKAYFKEALNDMEELEEGFEHIVNEFNNGNLFDDYPIPFKVSYSLYREETTIGLKIHLYYQE